MGGIQGGGGYLKLFGFLGPGFYAKGSFWDKWVVEPFGGTHDALNSWTGYDTVNDSAYTTVRIGFDGTPFSEKFFAPRFVGNIRPDYGVGWRNHERDRHSSGAPFALATIANELPPGTLQIINNAYNKSGPR